MPFYEYECPSCRYYLEVLQKISDKPIKKCPSCNKAGFKRLVSAPVFRLKGSGWYETDFKSDKEGQRNLAAAEPKEAKTEAPAAKTGDEKSAQPEAANAGASGKSESGKSETAAAADKKGKDAKPSPAPARSGTARRTIKRPAARAARKSSRTAKRGSRRR